MQIGGFKVNNKLNYILRTLMVVILTVCLVVIARMYKSLPHDNYVFDSKTYDEFDLNQLNHFAFEDYTVTDQKITCRGWFALDNAKASECKEMQVFLVSKNTHMFYKMNTIRQNRKDVDTYLRKRIVNPQEYLESGFTASINRSKLPAGVYDYYIYYRADSVKVMTKLPYRILI